MSQNTNKIYAVMKCCGEYICYGLFRTNEAAVQFCAAQSEICEIVDIDDNGNGADGTRYFGEFYRQDGDSLMGFTSAHTNRSACRAEMRSYPYPSWSRYTLKVYACDLH